MTVRRVLSFDVGRKNLACCLLRRRRDDENDENDDAWEVAFWHVFRVEDHFRGTRFHRELYRQFDEVLDPVWWKKPDDDDDDDDLSTTTTRRRHARESVVLVERQPRTNPQMRVVEAIVEAYFVIRGGAGGGGGGGGGGRCLDYSSRHKLGASLEGVRLDARVNTYAARKRAAVVAATRFVETRPVSASARGVWDAARKKDDLADALLQALSYVSGGSPHHPQHVEHEDDNDNETVSAQELRRWIPRREPKDTRNHVRKPYTRSQVKWIVTEWLGDRSHKTLPELTEGTQPLLRKQLQSLLATKDHARVARSVRHLWPDLDACLLQLCARAPCRVQKPPT